MKVLVLHAPAGYGHVKAAEVIAEALSLSGVQTSVKNSLNYTPCWFRTAYPASYFHSVKKTPWLWGALYELFDKPWVYFFFKFFRQLGNSIVGQALLDFVENEKPSMIISTHFFSAELLARAKRRGRLGAIKLLTVVTDFYPHSFWINQGTDFYWVMSDEASKRLCQWGVDPKAIYAKGIPVGTEFSENRSSREELRATYGLTEKKMTLLISGGSFGLGDKSGLLKKLETKFAEQIQCLVVCGHNEELYQELSKLNFSMFVKIFGFVDFMADLMRVSDLVVAKPGGLTTSECLSLGGAMVVHHPIPGQETRNADLLKKRKAAFFIENAEDLVAIVESVLSQPDKHDEVRGNSRKLGQPFATRELVNFVNKEMTAGESS